MHNLNFNVFHQCNSVNKIKKLTIYDNDRQELEVLKTDPGEVREARVIININSYPSKASNHTYIV